MATDAPTTPKLLILGRTGHDEPGVWHAIEDPELGIPADATAEEARAIIEAKEREVGIAALVARGAFGGSCETIVVDLAAVERIVYES